MSGCAPQTLLGPDTLAILLQLAETAPKNGCLVEVGVYKGGVAWHLAGLARQRGVELHLFDTFTGIPEKDPIDMPNVIGDFGDTSLEQVRDAIPDAVYHVGIFPDTMPDALPPIGFLHADCDQHRCCEAVIRLLWPLVMPGGTMLFDDYNQTAGVTAAVNAAFSESDLRLTPSRRAYVVKPAGQ